MLRRSAFAHGFSLIELMIIVAVIGVLSAVAFPSFSEWVQDTKTRTVAEALQNGLRLAQAESVKRGRQVQFFLTDSPPVVGATASSAGRNWVIQSMRLESANTVDEFIQGATLIGDAKTVSVSAIAGENAVSVVTFNAIGRVINPGNLVTYEITNSKGTRSLNVTVSLAGGVRMCDPAKTRSSSQPDGCN